MITTVTQGPLHEADLSTFTPAQHSNILELCRCTFLSNLDAVIMSWFHNLWDCISGSGFRFVEMHTSTM